MFIQARKLSIARGFSNAAVNKFKTSTLLPQQPGFHSVETYVRSVNNESEEVLVLIKWESKKNWQNWGKRDRNTYWAWK
ncbi:antibiotic biosynthesis monooxygenase [Trichococcus shcherbakoviae]|uniref:antibiotic biosynthesis monooxygenase n=1 Tax=Trichococcus shcherbakoviae TaxID=2094020 RepID=UPI0029F514B8|nr:antibiotic biosynthesis monooxygenase [Trichococcus shcherbakoviae]